MSRKSYVNYEAFDLSSISIEDITNSKLDINEVVENAKRILLEYNDFLSEKVDAEFEKDTWIFRSLSTYEKLRFDFNVVKESLRFNYSEDKELFLNLTKSWVAIQLGSKSLGTSYQKSTDILSAIYVTNCFQVDFWDKLINVFREACYCKSINKKGYKIAEANEDYIILKQIRTIIDFLQFCNRDKYALLIESLQEIILKYKYENKYRRLPEFKDILKLKDYLDYWFESALKKGNKDELLKFYPLVMWWNLTSIIPMRPIEFCKIKRDCLSSKDGKFFITFPRFKFHRKGEHRDKITYDTLPISFDVYELFNTYIRFTECNDSIEYLIDGKTYKSHTLTRHINDSKSCNFNKANLAYMLIKFYVDILNKKCKINISTNNNYNKHLKNRVLINHPQPKDTINSTILIGDLRHIAIINMMMQGYDKVEIQRLSGHFIEDTQFNYFNHMENWMDVEILKAEREILKISNDKNEQVNLHPKAYEFLHTKYKQLYINGKVSENSNDYIQLNIGACKDKLMTCPTFNWKHSGCYFCEHWTISINKLEENREIILSDLNLIYEELKDKINFMRSLYKLQMNNLDKTNINTKQDLSSTAKEVQQGIRKIAKLKTMLGVRYYE